MSFSLQMVVLLKTLVNDRITVLQNTSQTYEKDLLKLCKKELSEIEVFYQKKLPLLYSRRQR